MLIYLASPYSHPDPLVVQRRFEIVASLTGALFQQGLSVFSPIAYSHQFALAGCGGTFDTWKEFDIEMLMKCHLLAVLCLDGWNASKGVDAEIDMAEYQLEIPIVYVVDDPKIIKYKNMIVTDFNGNPFPGQEYFEEITWPRISEIADALRNKLKGEK